MVIDLFIYLFQHPLVKICFQHQEMIQQITSSCQTYAEAHDKRSEKMDKKSQ